jgi:uncharacterized protein YegJ (DUF2314 family)
MPTVYPDFERDGFFLDNGVMLAQMFPDTYRIPSPERRYALREGDTVKLSFRFAGPDQPERDYDTERMWVVARQQSDDHWIGQLDNDPRFHTVIRSGHELHFHPDHVIEIWQDPAA